MKCVFWFSAQILSTFPSLRRIQRRTIKNVIVVSKYGTRYSWQILTKPEFPRQIFRTIHKHQISWTYVQCEKSASMRAGGYAKVNSPFSAMLQTHLPSCLTVQSYEDSTCVLLAECHVRSEHEPRMEFANLPTTNQPARTKLQASNVANTVAVLPARCLLNTQHSVITLHLFGRTVLGVGWLTFWTGKNQTGTGRIPLNQAFNCARLSAKLAHIHG